MHDAIVQLVGNRDVGVAIQQIEYNRHQNHATEWDGSGHRNKPFRRGMNAGRVPVRLLDLRQDPPAIGKIALTGLRQMQ